MTKDDVAHLARLSRLALTPTELERYTHEVSSIVEYVSTIKALSGGEKAETPAVGALFNVARPDVVTVPGGSYTESLLAAFPEREGRFLKVKKILSHDE